MTNPLNQNPLNRPFAGWGITHKGISTGVVLLFIHFSPSGTTCPWVVRWISITYTTSTRAL